MATYDYGYWRLGQMTKVGFVIAVLWIPIMVAFMYGASGFISFRKNRREVCI